MNRKYEKVLFFSLLAGNLIPLFFTHYIGSLDAPKHLQIANIMLELWKGNPVFKSFFELSPIYTANVFSHYFLAAERFLMPAWLSEKMLLVFYVILIAAGFRYLVLSITKKPGWTYFFIFPMTYTSLFHLGFYNYSIAFGFLFFTVGFYLRNFHAMNWKNQFKLLLLVMLTYYAHFFVYGFLLFILAALSLQKMVVALIETTARPKFKDVWKIFRNIALPVLPSVLLAIPYLRLILQQPVANGGNQFNRWEYLFDFRVLLGYIEMEELPMTKFLFWTLLILFALSLGWIVYRIFFAKEKTNLNVIVKSEKFVWSLITIFFLAFFILMPNNLNGSGNILPRILIMVVYLFVLWLSLWPTHKIVNILIVITLVVYGSVNYSVHVKHRKDLDAMITEIKAAESQIPANSVTVFRNYIDRWNTIHFQSYIGTDVPLLNLNSLSISPLFAVNWRDDRPQTFVGMKYSDAYTYYINVPHASGTKFAEYLAVTGKKEFEALPETDEFKSVVNHDYRQMKEFNNSIVDLYKLNIEPAYSEIIERIKLDTNYLNNLKTKSLHTEVPLEDLVMREAIWIYDQKYN